MMALTFGTTGMDSATEAALHAAFKAANARTGGRWALQGEHEADYVVVDMDSMYGPMSWLRLHAAGKRVIGLTSAARTQTDFRLSRPFNADNVIELLDAIATQAGVPTAVVAAPAAAAIPADASVDAEIPAPAAAEPAAPALVAEPVQLAPAAATPARMPAPEPVAVAAPEPARERGFADWLATGALSGKVRYPRVGGQPLLIDADNRRYHGPAALKPLAGYFNGVVVEGDFAAVDEATWARDSVALGAAQPLSRLQWYAGLLAGKGVLLPGFDPAGKYKLGKWPQTEREFPKHFRIATAMMKGPATLDEIAAASGVSAGEVADFVNANLATGYAEFVPELPPEPEESAKPGGLFGRLRGK